MKRLLAILLALCLLPGCSAKDASIEATLPATVPETVPVESGTLQADSVTQVNLSDSGVTADGINRQAVYTSNDIIYYEDKEAYESGNPYGEGENYEKHSADEAAAHTVVNITAPGTYRVSGKLSKGQIRVDLGENAYNDPGAVVELVLDNADITCTVAPAVLFLNVYECDGEWSVDSASPDVDTSAAGANLVLEGMNTVSGSHVAKIFKDQNEEKKLWKQDGAIYSYMSMNVSGSGKLDLTADNEGLDTELHLTINGGDIAIRSDNDGINTNEDGVSVTTINGGNIHIIAGLGEEGDGIDSNGYLVINGGIVVSAANPAADAGMDSDLGSYIHGGTVIALGSAMDWAESDSKQVTMNLQFAESQSADAAVVVTATDGTILFAYDPGSDEVLAQNKRIYSGAVISCGNFKVGETYHVYVGGQLTGSETGGIFDPATVTSFVNSTQMAYTGTDVMRGPGGMQGMMDGTRPGMPKDMPDAAPPEGFGGERPEGMVHPRNTPPAIPAELPEGWQTIELPEGMVVPGNGPDGFSFEEIELPEGFTFDITFTTAPLGESSTEFYMQDQVNFFSGLTQA